MKGRFAGRLMTSVSVQIGRSGVKRHRLNLTIRPDPRPDGLVVLAGQTWCGSQRFGSGWHSARIDAGGVDCERCAARANLDDAPASALLQTDRRGKLVVQAGVTIDD